jgi:glyoxylate reductase
VAGLMERIFVTSALPGDALDRLGQCCELDVWSTGEPLPAEVLCERLQGCSGLLCLLTNRVSASLLDANPQLRWVSSMSVGVDHVDVPALTARGIPLGNTPGVLVETTADLNFALLLAAARRIPEADRYIRAGHWRPDRVWSPTLLTGKDVAGATLGIIGLGDIGQAVARRASGFGMRVLGWTRSGRQVAGVETLALDEVLAQSDFVSVNVALTDATRDLLDAAAIAQMKPGAVLVNTARGGIVDETALAAALAEGRLYAAGIDVFAREPVAMDNPLLGLPNVVVAPHIGSASKATRAQMAALAANNLIAAIQGEPMPHCVNPEVYIDR